MFRSIFGKFKSIPGKLLGRVGWLGGLLLPLGGMYAGSKFIQAIREFTGAYFHDLAIANPAIKVLFIVFLLSLFVTVFYSRAAQAIGVKPNMAAYKFIVWLLPVTFISLISYIGYANYLRHGDESYDYLRSVETTEEFIKQSAASGVDYRREADENRDYVFKIIDHGYSYNVYKNIFKSLNEKHLDVLGRKNSLAKRFKNGHTPLLYAVLTGNRAAVKALAESKHVDLRRKFDYTPPQVELLWSSMFNWSTNASLNTRYNVCKIAIYEGLEHMVEIIRKAGMEHRFPIGWYTADGQLGPADLPI